MALIQLFIWIQLVFAQAPQRVLSPVEESTHGASIESASANAASIFNAIHSSMRQWGSSIQHNGMSFFPAVVPKGTVLYHGDCNPIPPTHVDWLAFEIRHAELFTNGVCLSIPPSSEDSRHRSIWELQLEGGWDDPKRPPPGVRRAGNLQIYQANRPLKFLYVDGMGAAKSDFGPMDAQDRLLSLNFTRPAWAEWERVKDLCQLAAGWKLDGFIRMEAGFEIIKCDFSDGMDLLSARKRPPLESGGGLSLLEYMRDVSSRYNGIDGSRVFLDYSSMVSAYFYPTNLSNSDLDSDLPRLLFSTPAQLSRIRSDLGALILKADPYTSIDWQGVVDMISKEYSLRLQHMATDPPHVEILTTVNELVNLYVDYDDLDSPDHIEVCSQHYLHAVQPSTAQDHLIHAALSTVTHKICSTLFSVRKILFDGGEKSGVHPTSPAELIRSLMAWLDWPEWKFCGQCPVDEVCFVAVFPFGTAEDHFHPRCKNKTELEEFGRETNYWRRGRLPRLKPKPLAGEVV
ncbi:hypothetical protein OIDMADRAFT_54515 [Oidiodendron maius Zn]|uniref:Uncharacterized protein n=1 Tax=Oidiodendron maius (strain Zn) TaxID=913774 RepID=A0A0C3HG98_OIDMZ|nr:hypothetical protein OIDMADRAFT_54515 [Oidiodendron maius Zn]